MAAPPEDDDPWSALEQEADELLDALPDDDPAATSKALIDKLRKQLAGRAKQEQAAYDRGRQEALAEVKTQAERAKVLAKHGLPSSLQRLVDDVDVADEAALAARLEALRADGIRWDGQPAQSQPGQTAAPGAQAPPPDPGAIVGAFQQAQGAGTPADHGAGVLSRVAQGGLGALQNPQDAAQFESQLNSQIAALGAQAHAGLQG